MPIPASTCRAARLAAVVLIALTFTTSAPFACAGLAGPAQVPTREPVGDQLSIATQQLEIVVEQYNALREELRATRKRVQALDTQLAPLTRSIEAHRVELNGFAAHAYRTGSARSLVTVSALLSAAASNGLVDPLLMLDRLSRKQQRTIDRFTASRQRLAAGRQAAEVLASTLSGQERKLAARKLRIETEIARLDQLQTTESHPAPHAARQPAPIPGAAGKAVNFAYAQKAVNFAYAQLGKRYQWGGEGPDGYDCSGLTSAAWASAGVRLPHNAAQQSNAVRRVSRAERQAGDLVFYYPDSHHVGIYVGAGNVIHAPQPGQRIRIDRVDYQPVRSFGRPG